MRPSPRHEMVHKGTDAAGMEEWRCPVCGRHFIVRWPPDYERLVLAEGDGDATHVGTKDQVGLSDLEVARPAADDPTTQGDEDAWRRWLDEHGIDWDGDGPAS
jgi:hypothetical protein